MQLLRDLHQESREPVTDRKTECISRWQELGESQSKAVDAPLPPASAASSLALAGKMSSSGKLPIDPCRLEELVAVRLSKWVARPYT